MWPQPTVRRIEGLTFDAGFASAVLDRRLERGRPAPIAVAFSGGGDSLALLLAAQAWARNAGRPLLALTVDHGLHPDSADWTRRAGEVAARLGAAWRPLAWTGDKPAAGLPAAARRARHRLLAEAAREAGAGVILVGHTADDVLESELIRRDTPSHGRLCEWSPSPAWPEGRGIFLLRPLLAVRRAELRDWLRAQGQTWLDDPANDDLRYARARARATITAGVRASRRALEFILSDAAGGVEGGAPQHDEHYAIKALRHPEEPASAGVSKHARETCRSRGSRGLWAVSPAGVIALHRAAVCDASFGRRLLSAAIVSAAGIDRPPSGGSLDRLVERLLSNELFANSLSGARIEAAPAAVQVFREAGERARGGLSLVPLQPGRTAVFDGRFEVAADADAPPGLAVPPLAGRMARLSKADRARLRALPPAARGALPALVEVGGAVVLPRPFGDGPATARSLAGARIAAALGLIRHESDLPLDRERSRDGASHGALTTPVLS